VSEKEKERQFIRSLRRWLFSKTALVILAAVLL